MILNAMGSRSEQKATPPASGLEEFTEKLHCLA